MNSFNKGSRCSGCAKYGFKNYKPSYFYLISRPNQYKVGIYNEGSDRLVRHRKNGWRLVEQVDPNQQTNQMNQQQPNPNQQQVDPNQQLVINDPTNTKFGKFFAAHAVKTIKELEGEKGQGVETYKMWFGKGGFATIMYEDIHTDDAKKANDIRNKIDSDLKRK